MAGLKINIVSEEVTVSRWAKIEGLRSEIDILILFLLGNIRYIQFEF